MTAETSNARGDGRPGIDRLWDSQWVNIVNSPEVLEAVGFRDCEEAVNIAIRMTEQAMAKNFAAARGDVPYDRELIARMLDVCGHPKFTLEAYMEQARLLREADNAAAANVGTAALAAEGVQAGEVEQRARELLAALRLAMEWNWLDDDARPSRVAEICDAAIAKATSQDAALTGERNG